MSGLAEWPFFLMDKCRLVHKWAYCSVSPALESRAKAFYSSRLGSASDFTHVRLIFMNDSFIKCVSSILKY